MKLSLRAALATLRTAVLYLGIAPKWPAQVPPDPSEPEAGRPQPMPLMWLDTISKEHEMTILSELFDDAKFIFGYRKKVMKRQKALNAQAPKAGDLAPDFTLFDISGTKTVTLSDLRGMKPVALVFGSYT